ncbi:hypothetical protein [Streptomyces sp. NPDC048581]|uniref:hypothetical protein n=1 Tax=unclassified Streptomyces TaxID=2593676 RepID=UPI00371B3826
MRVATRASRAKTGTRRAGLGAKLVGIGLTTAVAIGISAGPAAAAAVNPVFVPGNPTLACPDGAEAFRIDPPVDTTVPVTVGAESGTVIVDFSDDLLQVNFDTTGNLAIRQVTVKGGPDANRYIYDANSTPTSFPDGIAMDTGLIPPTNPGGQPPEISHVDFCVIEGNGS